MIAIDKDVCRILAAKEGLPFDFIAKEFYLMDLLRKLSEMGVLDVLVFKGGTALNRIYMKQGSRFSEDLDFDFDGKDWNALFMKLKKITDFERIEARRIIQGKVQQIDYSYRTPWDKVDRVRLDINLVADTRSVEKISFKEIFPDYTGVGIGSVRVYGFEDLLARKMKALAERTEGKDIFDTSNALDMANKRRLLNALAIVASDKKEAVPEFVERIIKKLGRVDYKKIRNLANPYIPIRNRPSDWKILGNTLADRLKALVDTI